MHRSFVDVYKRQGLPEDTGKVIGGGPMMGKALVNIDVPTAKGSSGVPVSYTHLDVYKRQLL